jgi:hypothetical protein
MHHTPIDRDINMSGIDVWVSKQRGLYLCRDGSIDGPLGLGPAWRRRASNDTEGY